MLPTLRSTSTRNLTKIVWIASLSRLSIFPILSQARTLAFASHSRTPISRTNLIISPRLAPKTISCSRNLSSSTSATPETSEPIHSTTSLSDPDRPELFYHLFHSPTTASTTKPVFALSFLERPPVNVRSRTIIGWLPASNGSENEGKEEEAGLNDFVENAGFKELLHEAIQSGLKDGVDDIQKNGAIQVQQGWMHIHDERNIPALGRTGDPDDILGSVRVEEGVILAETYQPMPSYRLCTSDGIIHLTEGLATRLKERLEKEALLEKQS